MNKTKIDWADYSINPIKGMCRSHIFIGRLQINFMINWEPECSSDSYLFGFQMWIKRHIISVEFFRCWENLKYGRVYYSLSIWNKKYTNLTNH